MRLATKLLITLYALWEFWRQRPRKPDHGPRR